MISDIFSDGPRQTTSNQTIEAPLPSFQEQPDPTPQFNELSGRIAKLRYEMEQTLNTLTLRFQKIAQRIHGFDDRLKQSALENYERLNFLTSRVNEHTNSDTKVEAMIERHNQIVQSFELRLSQAQKVIENQSLQLARQQLLLDDARREIEKLKRL